MATPATGNGARVTRFGTFELATDSWELRHRGIRIKIERQPLQVLAALLDRPGELVTREELKKRLWPDETFVDFDHGINAAVKRLREALKDSATNPRFIETLPRRGYRFICPLNGQPFDNPTEADAASLRAPTMQSAWMRPTPARQRWNVRVGMASVVVLIGLVIVFDGGGRRDRLFSADRSARVTPIAVLPLEDSTDDPQQAHLADSLHDDLITTLSRILPYVRSERSVRRYGADSRKSGREIASELNVRFLIEGSVSRERNGLRVNVRLVDPTNDTNRWSNIYWSDVGGLSVLDKEIARDVAIALGITLTAREVAALNPGKPVKAEVYAAYSRGRDHHNLWTNDGEWHAIEFFEEAIKLDPSYAPAFAGLGLAYESLGTVARGSQLSHKDAFGKAETALRRAVELDPTIREAHQGLARISRARGDWEGAAREFQRAREVDSNWLGPETYLLAMGRQAEAVAAARRAAENNPWSYTHQLLYGWTLFLAGRYDGSIDQLKKAGRLDPSVDSAHYELAWNYIKKGMLDEAVAECDIALTLRRRRQQNVSVMLECGWVYASAGRRAQALGTASLLPIADDSRVAFDTDFGDTHGFRTLAQIYDALGDRDRALEYLAQSEDNAVPLADSPFFSEAIKADPRFLAIARKQHRFPPATGALAEVRGTARRSSL